MKFWKPGQPKNDPKAGEGPQLPDETLTQDATPVVLQAGETVPVPLREAMVGTVIVQGDTMVRYVRTKSVDATAGVWSAVDEETGYSHPYRLGADGTMKRVESGEKRGAAVEAVEGSERHREIAARYDDNPDVEMHVIADGPYVEIQFGDHEDTPLQTRVFPVWAVEQAKGSE